MPFFSTPLEQQQEITDNQLVLLTGTDSEPETEKETPVIATTQTGTMDKVIELPLFYVTMMEDFEMALLIPDEAAQKEEIKKLETHYKACNWITGGLVNEVKSLFLTSTDIDWEQNNPRDLFVKVQGGHGEILHS